MSTGYQKKDFEVADIAAFKQQVLWWLYDFEVFSYLDNNFYKAYKYSSYELLAGAGVVAEINADTGNAFQLLKQQYDQQQWLFGFLGYDLKNEVEKLQSNNFDGIKLPDLYFFQPEIIIELKDGIATISSISKKVEDVYQEISLSRSPEAKITSSITLKSRLSKEKYLENIHRIRTHIENGDVYELNFCQEFFAENVNIEPLAVFNKLNEISKAPFAAFLKNKNTYLLCGSPERFLKKVGKKLISQPIKGTIRRGINKIEDEQLKEQLQSDLKERAENVMIVDLVRNDLTRSSKTGTIKVEELFKIYSFESVNQMISTITSELREDVHPIDGIKAAFPMGSMTGAPKVMAMELIEKYEETKRGLYSGAVGYISPSGDFDFNVVIRSIIYNQKNQYLSYQTGGAITYDSVPEKEYEETILKGENLQKALVS